MGARGLRAKEGIWRRCCSESSASRHGRSRNKHGENRRRRQSGFAQKLLGEPAELTCVALATRAMLVHAGGRLEQFDEIVKSLGADFFTEFKNLERDPERMEKLKKKFPKETAKYEKEWQQSVPNNVKAETEAYSAERDFFSEVRAAWSEVCKSAVPAPEVGPPQGARDAQR